MSHEKLIVQDEIELSDLLRLLWKKKWFVVFITLIFMVASTTYFFFKKPVYQAKITFIPPIAADIAVLNFGRSVSDKILKPLVPVDAYVVLRGVVSAESTLQLFKKDSKLKKNKSAISIKTRQDAVGYSVVVEATSEKTAVDAVKAYVTMAERIARDKLAVTLSKELNGAALYIKKEMDEVRNLREKQRQAQLIRLKDALKIADSIDLKQPVSFGQSLAYTDVVNPAYLRGSRVLTAEINSLEKHGFDDAYNLQQLQEQYNLLQKIQPKEMIQNVNLLKMDGDLVVSNLSGVFKQRYILLSGVLGCLFAIFLLMMQQIKINRALIEKN